MNEVLLQATGLIKRFRTRGGIVRAVDGVDVEIARGETLGLVGESGCGKSTLGRLLVHLIEADAGHIVFDGREMSRDQLQAFRKRVQIVFQDPYRSLNPRRTAGDAIAEPALIHGLADKRNVHSYVANLLQEVGLDASAMDRFPHEFSGGQRQRIGIARALAVQPDFIVLDEPVAALDVSVQAQIVHLLVQLQRQRGLSYLFISHNLGVVRHIATRVAVMYLGIIVEMSPVRELYESPRHPYTHGLLEAVPEPDLAQSLAVELSGDAPDPINVPTGCRFHPRCRLARQIAAQSGTNGDSRNGHLSGAESATPWRVPDVCRSEQPPLRQIAMGQRAACHFAERMPEELDHTSGTEREDEVALSTQSL